MDKKTQRAKILRERRAALLLASMEAYVIPINLSLV